MNYASFGKDREEAKAMKIQQLDLTVRDLVDGYSDDGVGSKTVEENCQMLCRKCNREKSSK